MPSVDKDVNYKNHLYRHLGEIAAYANAALTSKEKIRKLPQKSIEALRKLLHRSKFNPATLKEALNMNAGVLSKIFKTGGKVSAKVSSLKTLISDLKLKLLFYERFNEIFKGTLSRINDVTKQKPETIAKYFLGHKGPGLAAHQLFIAENINNTDKLFQYRKELSKHRNSFIKNFANDIFSDHALALKFERPELMTRIQPAIKKLAHLVFLNHLKDKNLNLNYRRPVIKYANELKTVIKDIAQENIRKPKPALHKKILANAYNLVSMIVRLALRAKDDHFGESEQKAIELLIKIAGIIDSQKELEIKATEYIIDRYSTRRQAQEYFKDLNRYESTAAENFISKSKKKSN